MANDLRFETGMKERESYLNNLRSQANSITSQRDALIRSRRTNYGDGESAPDNSTLDAQIGQLESSLGSINSQLSDRSAEMERFRGAFKNDPNLMKVSNRLTADGMGNDQMGRDMIKGSQFGEAVLGTGLGRLGEDTAIQDVLSRYKQFTEHGYGADVLQAQRDIGKQEIGRAEQTSSRQLQAQLARSGIRGPRAAAALTNLNAQSALQRSNLERDMFIKNAEVQQKSLEKYGSALGEIRTYDLGQIAAEKNIALQAGLGFAQMGSSERGAKYAAEQAANARAAQSSGGCHVAGVKVVMQDGTEKNIEDIKIGDRVHMGGKVFGIGVVESREKFVVYGDFSCTESHNIVSKLGSVQNVMTVQPPSSMYGIGTLVYPIYTEYGFYVTSDGNMHGDVYSVHGTEIEKLKV